MGVKQRPSKKKAVKANDTSALDENVAPKGKAYKSPEKMPVKAMLSMIVGVVMIIMGVTFVLVPDAFLPKPEANVTTSEPTTIEGILKRAEDLPCKDRHDPQGCANYALNGHCKTSPGWMAVMCAASCNSCELLDPAIRCDRKRMGMVETPSYQPGDLKKLFEGLPERYPNNNVQYLSREPEGPWIVSIDNFVNDEEIEALLTHAGDLRRSTDQGKVHDDGYQEQVVSKSRTSSNAWCNKECESQPLIKGVSKRISELTNIPVNNFESFQVLRYNVGEFYKTHHDMSNQDNELPCGPRILTVFVYLNDVEEGGGTNFPKTKGNLTMVPKKGSIVMWPSVLDSDLTVQDRRTLHQALPVTKGVKYGANHWIHLYDYKTPNHWGCTGSFA